MQGRSPFGIIVTLISILWVVEYRGVEKSLAISWPAISVSRDVPSAALGNCGMVASKAHVIYQSASCDSGIKSLNLSVAKTAFYTQPT
jgi:hypothetical protein